MTLANDMQGAKVKEHERIGTISRNMKLICRGLDIAGVVIHSLIKTGMRADVPENADLRGEAGVSFDADLITFLVKFKAMTDNDKYINKQDKENLLTLLIGKGRELPNPRKYIHMVKSPNYPHFLEYAPTKEPNGFTDHTR